MNPFKYFSIFIFALIGLSSCENADEPKPSSVNSELFAEGEETILTAVIPEGMRNRAGSVVYGRGMYVDRMRYAVYNKYGNIVYHSEMDNAPTATSSDDKSRWSLTLKLIKNDTYSVFFWVEKTSAGYSINYDDGTIYNLWSFSDLDPLNNEYKDAFYCYQQFTAGQTSSFILTRPLARVVIISKDLVDNSDMSLKEVICGFSTINGPDPEIPTSFNFKTGKVAYGTQISRNNIGYWGYNNINGKFYENFGYSSDTWVLHYDYIFAPKTSDGWSDFEHRYWNDDIKQIVIIADNMTVSIPSSDFNITEKLLANSQLTITLNDPRYTNQGFGIFYVTDFADILQY